MAETPHEKMKYNNKEGRRAQAHNGYHLDGLKSPSHNYSEARPQNEVLQSKSRGGSKAGKSGSFRTEKSRKAGQELFICTYNTRTIRTEESLQHLLDELEEFKWDIIGLAETRREGEGFRRD